jgi:hypothetical protein
MDHCNKKTVLTGAQLNTIANTIQQNIYLIANSTTVVSLAFDIINCYETNTGAIFTTPSTKDGFPNSPGALDGFEYTRVVFMIQQGLLDYLYTKDNIVKYSSLILGKKYLTSNYFPGACSAPVNPTQVYTTTINASKPTDWGNPTAWSSVPARKATGYYLSTGSIGKVKVPASMVNAGFKILVGASTIQNTNSDPLRRFYRVFNTFDITTVETQIANPFGGGIYILVPNNASAGLQQIELTNVVPAPFFSAKSFNKTSLSDWQNVQRHNPAPWADFESEKFMMQVPTSFIYNYNDPVTLMADWDARIDVITKLLGYPAIRNNVLLYLQLDINLMGGSYAIGYPQVNNTFNPNDVQNGNSDHWFLSPGAAKMWETEFHETGHSLAIKEFPGEGEAIVNLLSAKIYNQLYGMDIDSALGMSFDFQAWRTRSQAAINWMVTPNFRNGKPMDISNTITDEVRYQHRGYAKYIEIAALFGWEVLEKYFYQENLDYINGVTPTLSDVDDHILKLSKIAGVDLRPLIHFWGVQPDNPTALAQAITSNNLKPSPLICNRLSYYKSIIPLNNAQFRTHAQVFFNGPVPSGGDPAYGEGWYNYWLPLYNTSHGTLAATALQNIINLYFPNGCGVLPIPAIITPYTQINGGSLSQNNSVVVCSGTTFSFAPQPTDGTWKWTGPNGYTSNSRVINFTNSSPTNAGTYSVTYTNPSGSSATATFKALVNAPPILTTSANVSLCKGSATNLVASGSGVYAWSSGQSLNNTTEWHFNSDGNTEGWGLANQLTGAVANGVISANLTGNDPFMFSDWTLTIPAATQNKVRIRMKNATSGTQATLRWLTSTDGDWWTNDKVVYFPIKANDADYTEYVLDMTQKVNWKDLVTMLRFDPVESGASSGTVSIDWIKITSDQSITVSPQASTTYSVTTTDKNTCTSTANIAVTVNALPTISPTIQINGGAPVSVYDTTIVAGQSLVLSPLPTVATGWTWTGPNSYSASTRQISFPSIAYNQAGTYSATYSDANGCKASFSQKIRIKILQTINLNKGVNLISTNVIPTDSSITTIFAGLDVLEIKTMNAFWRKGQNTSFNSLQVIE